MNFNRPVRAAFPKQTGLVTPGRQLGGDFPFHWCNLNRNPFGELSADERAAVAIVDFGTVLPKITCSHHAVQFLGDCGRGKTTRMLALCSRLKQSAYVYLAEDQPCPALPAAEPLLVDEAQRLPRAARKMLFASGVPLVLATHHDLQRPLMRNGYHVMTYRIGDQCDAALIQRIMNRRIEWCRLAPGKLPTLTLEDAELLHRRFGSDLRGAESYLYESMQRQAFGHGEVRFVD
ncbi:MAG: hypothetical protein AAGA03_09510 [Planctomycetota bacterium]